MSKSLFFKLLRIKDLFEYIMDKIWAFFLKKSMGECGKNVLIRPSTSIFKGIHNIHLASNIRIARYAVIYSAYAKVYIGEKVGIAPYLKIITGNKRVDQVGLFMFDGDVDKRPEDDQDVIIEGDSWFGINVTILSGVTIGRGSVIAAGSIVNKSCPPYSIVAGVPAKVIRYRFTIDEVLEHENKLYPADKRYKREDLGAGRDNYNSKNKESN